MGIKVRHGAIAEMMCGHAFCKNLVFSHSVVSFSWKLMTFYFSVSGKDRVSVGLVLTKIQGNNYFAVALLFI